MKNILIIVFSLLMYSCKAHVQKTNIKDTVQIAEIHFQDFFKNDTISLFIETCNCFENVVISSDESIGLTNLIIEVFQNKVLFLNTSKTCNLDVIDSKLLIKIRLNGKVSEFLVDLKNGKNIGINKKSKNELTFNQSVSRFIYD
jgi:hypothetical protein